MKRIVTLLLAAGLVLGASVGSSKAADVKVSGVWQFGFEWMDSDFKKESGSDTFTALQRLRTKIDIITSENLRGVAFFEIGKSRWGSQSGGAALGTDGFTVKVRYSYVDWVVPNTDLKIRMGLQPWLLPNFTKGSAILDADGAGITASYQFNDMFGATLGWLRAENDNSGLNHDALDLVMLSLPVTGDGFKVTPWGLMGIVGKNSMNHSGGDVEDLQMGLTPVLTDSMIGGANFNKDPLKNRATAWWAGLSAEMTMFSPFRLAADFTYGSIDRGELRMEQIPGRAAKNMDVKRAGWYASLLAEYKLDMVTPGLYFWYASGDDSNPYNGSERMPVLDAAWYGTKFGYDDSTFDGSCFLADNPTGTWGAALMLSDISFMENLSHFFEVAYIRGTNNKDMPLKAGMMSAQHQFMDTRGDVGYTYMTTKDDAWEVDFTTKYNIYKDLALMLELGYIRLNLDTDVWGTVKDSMDKDAYKVGVYMQYNF